MIVVSWYLWTRDFETYVYQAPEVVEKTVEVDALEEAIKAAQEVKKAEIESIAQTAWQEAYNQEMTKVELEVVRGFSEKLDARQVELEEEISL